MTGFVSGLAPPFGGVFSFRPMGFDPRVINFFKIEIFIEC